MAQPRPAERPLATQAIGLGAFFLLCFLVSALGGWVTASSVGTWYQGLSKPAYTPPDWIFGPVWSLLFAMIATSGWLVWRRKRLADAPLAFKLYALQLGLNLIWSITFFGLRSPAMGMFAVLLLCIAVFANLLAFLRHDRLAALLLVPYLAWVSFAALLNHAIWQLN